MFIRPAMSESNFNLDDDYDPASEWGISSPEDQPLVSQHPADGLIPHPSCSGAEPATAAEARDFWLNGGWDE